MQGSYHIKHEKREEYKYLPEKTIDGKPYLEAIWSNMDNSSVRQDIINESERIYAPYTLPWIFRENADLGEYNDTLNSRLPRFIDIGPHLVNSLSSSIVDLMFPNDRPFFTPKLSKDFKKSLGDSYEQKKGEINTKLKLLQDAAIEEFDLTEYRPKALSAVKLMMVTGNALILREKTEYDEDVVMVRNMHNYCIERDQASKPSRIMTCDIKKFRNLPDEYKTVLDKEKQHNGDEDIRCYQLFERYSQKMWLHIKGVEKHILSERRVNRKDLGLIPLSWHMPENLSYSPGLVQDHNVLFTDLYNTNSSLHKLRQIIQQTRVAVDPASGMTTEDWYSSEDGDTLAVHPDAIKGIDLGLWQQYQQLTEDSERIKRTLYQIFLYDLGLRRDGERVTAEEIRYFAFQLQKTNSELYSTLTKIWLKQEAEYLLKNFDTELDIEITTGIENLSREGQLTALVKSFQELGLMANLPENVLGVINPQRLTEFVLRNNYVPYQEFVYTDDELKQIRAQQEEQMQKQMQMQMQIDAAKRQ